MDNTFFVDENITCQRETPTPSGRFILWIRSYTTKEGCWNYSRGTILRATDRSVVCDIKRNYSTFHHSFINKGGQEWMITGRSYMSQTIVNLDTGVEYEPPGDQKNPVAFCWADTFLSPDESILVVDGCHWACPYEFRFYDFSDPTKGWPQLEMKDCLYSDKKKPIFNADGTITCFETLSKYIPLGKYEDDIKTGEVPDADYDDETNWELVDQAKTTYRRDGNTLVVVDTWVSDEELERRKQREEAHAKWEAWRKEFKTTDPLYLKYAELLKQPCFKPEEYESTGFTYPNWCPTFKGEEKRWCRRIFKKEGDKGYTIDLDWGVKTGPIRLSIYKDGKHLEYKFFEHSIDGMTAAFNHAQSLL